MFYFKLLNNTVNIHTQGTQYIVTINEINKIYLFTTINIYNAKLYSQIIIYPKKYTEKTN